MKTRTIEWSVIALLAATLVGVLSLQREAERGSSGEAPAQTARSDPDLPPVQVTELLDLAKELSPAEIPEPLPRPELGYDSLSQGLPSEGQWRGHGLLADLDADGHLDLVTSVRRYDSATPGEGLMVYLGDGAGSWRPATQGMRRDMGYGGSAVADLDKDGHLDLAFSGHDIAPHVFLGDGTGRWRAETAGLDLEAMCADVAVGDLDRDGWPDLAALGFHRDGGNLYLFAGVGGGTFVRLPELLPDGTYGARVMAHDLDGDGHPELLATTSLGPKVWHWNDGAPVDDSAGLPAPEIGGSDLGLDVADLDGDGRGELLVSGMFYPGHEPLRVWTRAADGWTRWGAGLPEDESFFDATFADLEGGGSTWIVLAGRAGIGLVRMTAPGEFESVGRLKDTLGVFNVAAGDVDEDGRDEIVFVGIGGVRVLRPHLPSTLATGESS